MIERQGNLISVHHRGKGDAAAAERLCAALCAEVQRTAGQTERVAILHDSTELSSADEAYARTFAHCFDKLGPNAPIQAAHIERALLRVLARVAMTLSGTNLAIFKTRDECLRYLRAQGLTDLQ